MPPDIIHTVHQLKQLFRKLHLWLSIPFGLIITLICFSGAMLVFEQEVMQFTHRSLYYVDEVKNKPLPVDELVACAKASLPNDVAVQNVTIFHDPHRAYHITLSKPPKSALIIDQYTGEIKGRSQRTPFFSTMFRLHRWLLGSRPNGGGIFWGKTIVGISTLLFVLVLISGVIIWWPHTIKGLKNGLRIKFYNGSYKLWHGLHVAGGMYALLLLLVMALTGLTWSFNWYRTVFYKSFGVEMQQRGNHNSNNHVQNTAHDTAHRYEHWQQVYSTLAVNNPNNMSISIGDGTAVVSHNRYGNTRGGDKYRFNPNTGEIIESIFYKDLSKSGKIRGWIYSVHTGTFGGTITRLIWFLAALLGATLPITGYYLWIKKTISRNKNIGNNT